MIKYLFIIVVASLVGCSTTNQIHKDVIIYDTTHKAVCCIYDTTHKQIIKYDTTKKTVTITDTTFKTKTITDTIKKVVNDTAFHHKDSTIYKYVTKTITDTTYKNVTITKTDTVRKTITITDTTHKDSVIIKYIFNTITITDTVYSHKDSTIYNYIIKTDTTYKNVTITHTDTVKKTITINDTTHKKVIINDTSFNHIDSTIIKIIIDTVRKHITITDTAFYHKDSIIWHYIDSIRIIYSDSCVQSNPLKTEYGVLPQSQTDFATGSKIIQDAGLSSIRMHVFFGNNYFNKGIDQYLIAGIQVNINFNWLPTSTPIDFCKDTALIRKQAKLFFQYYLPYKNLIPFVSVENEWDNNNYRIETANVQDYLTELSIVVDEGHKLGFKVADAGTTGNSLQRWMYSQLPPTEAKEWALKYFVGANLPTYQPMLDKLEIFRKGIANIPIDFLNVHWYNNQECYGEFPLVASTYSAWCVKPKLISNEFGIRNNISQWDCTVNEIKLSNLHYAIAYSGEDSNALPLTVEMLQQLK